MRMVVNTFLVSELCKKQTRTEHDDECAMNASVGQAEAPSIREVPPRRKVQEAECERVGGKRTVFGCAQKSHSESDSYLQGCRFGEAVYLFSGPGVGLSTREGGNQMHLVTRA